MHIVQVRETQTEGVVPPPPGVTPDLDGSRPDGRFRDTNFIIASIGISLCTICLSMRVYTKARLLRKFWWDDGGYNHAGYGLHTWDMTTSLYSTYTKGVLASAIIYIPALAFAKLALLILFYTLLSLTPFWKYLIYTIAFLISGYSIALILALIFGCSPIEKAWNPRITEGTCISQNGVYLATAVTNTVSDLVLIMIPVPIVAKLRLGFWRRVGVVCMFGVGGLTTIMSIVRLATLMPQITTEDQPWGLAEADIFIIIEANLIVLCACLPYLRQFIRHHAPRCISESSSFGHRISRCRRSSQEKGDRTTGIAPLQAGVDVDIERALAVNGPIPSSHHSGEEVEEVT
ncbi:hypothetical protein BDV12DRAFT_208736 [Aspergillus spectabilis]